MAKRKTTSKVIESAPPPPIPAGERLLRLDEILGQEAALDVLQRSLEAGRVHHAWIFSGPAGVGKRSTAEAFAAWLLDPDIGVNLMGRPELDPGSPVQRLMASRSHPDLHLIAKELAAYSASADLRDRKQTNIPIDLLRERMLGGEVGTKYVEPIVAKAPSMGHHKVFIIDEAELLDIYGQNALLKTLEEPPEGTYLILVTTAEDRLLPTIRSRCQRVAFNPLSEAAMEEWLSRRAIEPAPTAEERAWVLRFASGSPGRALVALRTGLFNWAVTLEPMLREADAGRYRADLGPTMARLVDEWAAQWVKERDAASKEAANRAAAGHLFTMIADRARHALRQSAGRDAGSVTRAMRAIDIVQEAEELVRRNVQLGMAMEYIAVESARTPAGAAT